MFFNLFFVFFTDQTRTKNSNPSQEHKPNNQELKSQEYKPSNQELKSISEEHKRKLEEKIKLNTNRKFSSCSSQIKEATKTISSKPQIQIQIQIQQPNPISIKSRKTKNKSKKQTHKYSN